MRRARDDLPEAGRAGTAIATPPIAGQSAPAIGVILMVRKMIVLLCLFSLAGVIGAGCHAGVETDKGHGASVGVG
jgi:hypothetical protein